MSNGNDDAAGGDQPWTELEALREAVRVMFGFRSREEVADLFKRKLVRQAVASLERSVEQTRARRQPDEFAFALAIEMELLKQARVAGELETLFNDPNHHSPPTHEITDWIASLWCRE